MKSKILVVDDYAYNRLIYRHWLSELPGVEIVEAATGQQALELAAATQFALCLVDVGMPDLDGFELTARLRAIPGRSTMPIVLVTADATERRYMTQGYRCGAADFLASATTRGTTLQQKARVFVDLHHERLAQAERIRSLQLELEASVRKHDELRTQAIHDPLTRLPNRVLFRDRLHAACARASRNRGMFALAYLDLDGFKNVNDRHGHLAGDALIANIGQRLAQAVRATDTVARLGGDEFGLLMEGIAAPERAEQVARKVHQQIARRYQIELPDRNVEIGVESGCSIGVAIYPDHATDVERLLFRADMAMYAAKQDGGGVRLYGEDMFDTPARVPAERLAAMNRMERH